MASWEIRKAWLWDDRMKDSSGHIDQDRHELAGLLADGWEPFSVSPDPSVSVLSDRSFIWLRKKVEDG